MVTNNACDEPTAASGKILQGQGVGTASNFSTATYPSTATGTGKILRADGTNWVASTATYPDTAGTSGNILTSDGTNWTSSTPGSTANLNGFIGSSTGNPADSTTYYFVNTLAFTSVTSATDPRTIFYVPKAVTLAKVYGTFTVNGTLGSAQNCTLFIRVNNSSNTNITSTIQLTSSTNNFNNTALALSLSAGDFFNIGFTGPAWTTNPTTVSIALGWST